MNNKFEEIVEAWFKREQTASVMFPDGWFGRPFDSLFHLTKIDFKADRVAIQLENNLNLEFYDLTDLKDKGRELIFSKFSKLEFQWTEFGDAKAHHQSYQEGVVKFISRPADAA